jgi:two-component system chemotaxis sensor kinase CheA
MDVVKQKLKELRGSIEITTEEGLGTAFTLRLPLSLSILDVLHVKVNEVNYLLPHNEVEMCLSERLNSDTIQRKGYNVKYKGHLIPYMRMREIVQTKSEQAHEPAIIIINKNDQHVAIEVDEIVGKEQLVIKPVDEALKSLEYLSGVAVLGNGELAFLVNSLKLKESFSYEHNTTNT